MMRALQTATSQIATTRDEPFELIIRYPIRFYESVFRALERYRRRRELNEFTFSVSLNHREFQSNTTEARFIRNVIATYDYSVGDKVRCLYALNESYCAKTVLRLVREFDRRARESICTRIFVVSPCIFYNWWKVSREMTETSTPSFE